MDTKVANPDRETASKRVVFVRRVLSTALLALQLLLPLNQRRLQAAIPSSLIILRNNCLPDSFVFQGVSRSDAEPVLMSSFCLLYCLS